MVSRIAPKLAQEQNCRLTVVANEKRLLIFFTALSETPDILRRVLMKIQILRDMMLCQRVRTDLTNLRTIVTSLIFRMTQSEKNHCKTMKRKN